MAQKRLKSFNLPLMRGFFIKFNVIYTYSIRGRVIGDNPIVSWAKVLLGCEYANLILLRGLFFSGSRFVNESDISDLGLLA